MKYLLPFTIGTAIVIYILMSFISNTFNPKEMGMVTKICGSFCWVWSLCAYADININKTK